MLSHAGLQKVCTMLPLNSKPITSCPVGTQDAIVDISLIAVARIACMVIDFNPPCIDRVEGTCMTVTAPVKHWWYQQSIGS